MAINNGSHIAVAGLSQVHRHACWAGYCQASCILEHTACLSQSAVQGRLLKHHRGQQSTLMGQTCILMKVKLIGW